MSFKSFSRIKLGLAHTGTEQGFSVLLAILHLSTVLKLKYATVLQNRKQATSRSLSGLLRQHA